MYHPRDQACTGKKKKIWKCYSEHVIHFKDNSMHHLVCERTVASDGHNFR